MCYVGTYLAEISQVVSVTSVNDPSCLVRPQSLPPFAFVYYDNNVLMVLLLPSSFVRPSWHGKLNFRERIYFEILIVVHVSLTNSVIKTKMKPNNSKGPYYILQAYL